MCHAQLKRMRNLMKVLIWKTAAVLLILKANNCRGVVPLLADRSLSLAISQFGQAIMKKSLYPKDISFV